LVSNRADVIAGVGAALRGRVALIRELSEITTKPPYGATVLIDPGGLPSGVDPLVVRLAWRTDPILALADQRNPVSLTHEVLCIADGIVCLDEVGRLLAAASELADESLTVLPTWFEGEKTLRAARQQRLAQLSPSVQRVAALLSKGHSNPEIAAALEIPETTVKTDVARILQTLGFSGRTEAAVFLWQLDRARKEGHGTWG
jgi:DNA-binding CsgD family transcriptional regulator